MSDKSDEKTVYSVTLSVTFNRTVNVKAKSAEKAAKKAIKRYEKGKIVVAKGKPATREIAVSQPDIGYYENFFEF